MTHPDPRVHALVDDLFRRTAARVVAALMARLGPGHLDLAEDVTQDAMLAALRTWPFRGIPDDPAGWVYRAAWNRALDRLRRDATATRLSDRLAAEQPQSPADQVPDDVLGVLLTCAGLPLSRDVVVPLALNVVAGLSAREIARALLLDEPAVAQRLVRAKRRLRAEPALVSLRSEGAALATALPAALEVVYLVFNEGFSPTSGSDPIRLDLVAEGLRLAQALAAHPATAGSSAHALAALTHFLAARLPARADGGLLVLLPDQDRSLWDRRLIEAGFRHLHAAIGGDPVTRLHLEAEIAALHAAAPSFSGTDWTAIVGAYDKLLALEDSAVIRLNRAVAVAQVHGAAAGLAELELLAGSQGLARSPWFHAARGHLLAALGRAPAAAASYENALQLTEAGAAREFLRAEIARLRSVSG